VTQVVAADGIAKFGPRNTPWAYRIRCYLAKGCYEKRLITASAELTELVMRVSEKADDILLRGGR
jgi:hypothetical protein